MPLTEIRRSTFLTPCCHCAAIDKHSADLATLAMFWSPLQKQVTHCHAVPAAEAREQAQASNATLRPLKFKLQTASQKFVRRDHQPFVPLNLGTLLRVLLRAH